MPDLFSGPTVGGSVRLNREFACLTQSRAGIDRGAVSQTKQKRKTRELLILLGVAGPDRQSIGPPRSQMFDLPETDVALSAEIAHFRVCENG